MMKRAQPLEILTGLGQRDVLANDVGDINSISDLSNNVLRNQASAHESRSSYIPAWHDRAGRFLNDRKN